MTLRTIAEFVGGTVEGDEELQVGSIGSLDEAGDGDLTYAINEHKATSLKSSKATAAIVPHGASVKTVENPQMALVRVANPEAAVATLLRRTGGPEDLPAVGIHPSAVIASDAEISDNVAIGPCVVVGQRAKIGDGSVLCPGAKVGADAVVGENCVLSEGAVVRYECVVGDRVRIGSNSVIGYDGFGYYYEDGVHHKIPHPGNVVIEDDVELGACTCVDRSKWGSTRIGAGTKIDNLVQIAHYVQVGPGCLLASQAGVAGSSKLGKFVVLGGSSGVRDNISIGDGTKLGAASNLAQSAGPGELLLGTPAKDAKNALREVLGISKLPDMIKRVKKLEKKISELESKGNGE